LNDWKAVGHFRIVQKSFTKTHLNLEYSSLDFEKNVGGFSVCYIFDIVGENIVNLLCILKFLLLFLLMLILMIM
jgi:hypothetical protein